MESFLKSVERRAFRMAHIATRNPDDALDILQDAMLGFVRAYSDKPREQWKPLFYRTVQNKIRDWHRRSKVRSVFSAFVPGMGRDREGPEPERMQTLPDRDASDPQAEAKKADAMRRLEDSLGGLPPRQQQAFLLRAWEGLSVRDTAVAMGCSEGSVKTHYSRAVHALRDQLEDTWP